MEIKLGLKAILLNTEHEFKHQISQRKKYSFKDTKLANSSP